MKKYILANFDNIIREEDKIILLDKRNNKEIILKGYNISKYFIGNIDLLREYISITELIKDKNYSIEEDYTNIEILFDKLVERNVLSIYRESKINFKSRICILDFNPSNFIRYFFNILKNELGIKVEYFVPDRNVLNDNIKYNNFSEMKILEDIELYILINYRFNYHEGLLSEFVSEILKKKKSILHVTIDNEYSIIGPLVIDEYNASYRDREIDLFWYNNKIPKQIEINKEIDIFLLNKICSELFNEIKNFYDINNSYSNYVNEYLIIDNRNSISLRRSICITEERKYD